MRFSIFLQREIDLLRGNQLSDGSWLSEEASTCSALETLLEYEQGPQAICRHSYVRQLADPAVEPLDWLRLSYRTEDASAVYRGIRYLVENGSISGRGNRNRWLESKELYILTTTDPDYMYFTSGVVIDEFPVEQVEEPWLIALRGMFNVHNNPPWMYYGRPHRTAADSEFRDQLTDYFSTLPGYSSRLRRLMKRDHWDARTVSPEESTAIVLAFLLHDCTRYLLKLWQDVVPTPNQLWDSANWLLARQGPDGGWAHDIHVTSHCLRAIATCLGCQDSAKPPDDILKRSIDSGITYITATDNVAVWDKLNDYKHIDILGTITGLYRSNILASDNFDALEIDSETASTRVFVSHSHMDGDYCRKLVALLRTYNLDVWYDEHNLDTGVIRRVIESELLASQHFIVVLSPEAIASDWVNAEIDAAIDLLREHRLRTFVPVIAKPCTVPPLLRRYKRIDGPGGKPVSVQEAAERLIDILRRRRQPSFFGWRRRRGY